MDSSGELSMFDNVQLFTIDVLLVKYNTKLLYITRRDREQYSKVGGGEGVGKSCRVAVSFGVL